MTDSTPAVLATWEFYAKEYNLDLTEVLRSELSSHIGCVGSFAGGLKKVVFWCLPALRWSQ